MALSAKEMQVAIEGNLEKKTGRTIEAWLIVAETAQLSDERLLVKWLKAQHGLGHVTAQLVAARSQQKPETYADEGALLRRLFDRKQQALLKAIEAMLQEEVPSVERVVCKTYVGFRAPRQFATIRPVDGASAVALAFALGRDGLGLLATRFRGGGGMTHEVKISDKKQIDEVRGIVVVAAAKKGQRK